MFGAIAGVTAFGTLSGLAVQAASAAPTGNNLAGADRYQTAGNLNAAKFGSGGVSTVLLADGVPGTPGTGANGHEVDALSVGGYAGLNKYGLLLTDNTNTVPANTMTALSTLKAKNVIAVGGSASVSAAQVSQLTSAGYTVTQPFQGADRYATMQMVDNSFTPSTVGHDPSGNNTAILASGDYAHMVDALSAGGLAYKMKFPVILTPTGSSTLGSQAAAVISNLKITHLIVVGGTASIPASQYTPAPSGVTKVDVLSGADRSATSLAIAQAAVSTYGFSTTKLGVAAGATFVGSTSQVQNDGADALSSAPYLGDPEPMCVTNGPTDVGSAPKCVSTFNPTTVDWLTGTANLTTSQQTTILAGSGGGANTYTVSGGSATAMASTSTAQSQGVETYTVSGLPSNSPVDIALFPCQGNPQTGNNTVNGAPTTSSSGSTTFTAPGGTSPAAGSAIGEGTSTLNNNGSGAGLNGTGASNGSASAAHPGLTTAYSSTAYIASVNGVPTSTSLGTNGAGGPTEIVAPAGSTLSFVVNSFSFDCAIPVVYTVPSSVSQTVGATGTGVAPLLVNSNGTPQTGYSIGVGGLTFWQAQAAPATATPYDVSVIASIGNTFDGLAVCNPNAGVGATCPAGISEGTIYSYNDGTSGDAFGYTDKTPVTQANFVSYLSGPGTAYFPNTTTAQTVPGDVVTIGSNGIQTTGYSSSSPSDFQLQAATAVAPGATCAGATSPCDAGSTLGGAAATYAADAGDVPAAPTNITATPNSCAFLTGTTCNPGVLVTWTPPANPDVSGSEAVPGGVASNAGDATYTLFRETVTTSGSTTTYSAPTTVGTVTVVASGFTGAAGITNQPGGNTSVSSPEEIDTTPTTTPAVYYVVATPASAAGDVTSSGCTTNGTTNVPTFGGVSPCTGPASAPSAQVTGTAAVTPTMKEVVITPSVPFTSFGNGASGGGGTPNGSYYSEGGVPATATITYNTAVTCLGADGANFSYSNSGGTGTVKGTSCQTGSSTNQLVVTLAQVTQSGSGATATFTQNTVKVPGNGDTFTYTVPSPQTTANSVYSGTAASPNYAATQTVTSNGGAASSSNALGTGTGVPVIGSIQVGATGTAATVTMAITYNEAPTCPAATLTAAQAAQFVYQVSGGASSTAATGATCAVAGNTMTITGWTAGLAAVGSGDTFTYTSDGTAADAPHATDSISGTADAALTPQTLTATAADTSEPPGGGQGPLWET